MKKSLSVFLGKGVIRNQSVRGNKKVDNRKEGV
jgi:hypothetical protein